MAASMGSSGAISTRTQGRSPRTGSRMPPFRPAVSSSTTPLGSVISEYIRGSRSSRPSWYRYWIGDVLQMTSGTRQVLGQFVRGHAEAGDAVVGEPAQEDRLGHAGQL